MELDNPNLEQLIKSMFPAQNYGTSNKQKVGNASNTTPTRQQQPDTFVQDETQIVRGPLGPTYATKLVRGQPDDLSKALTRIKELETALGAVRGYIGMATWEYVDQYRECLEIIDNAI